MSHGLLPALLSITLIYSSLIVTQAHAQNTLSYTEQPFDPALDKLPPQYIGHDPEALVNPLQKLAKSSKKTEFETTNEFNSRIYKQRSLPILGNLTIDNIFAFSTIDVQVAYDADRQTLDITVSKLICPHPSERGLTLLSKILSYPDKHYEGVNAFGVRANVTETNYKKFNIVFNNYRDLASKSKSDNVGTQIYYTAKLKNMNAQLAADAKQNIRLLVICKIIEPFTTSGETKYDATISHPVKLVESNTAIYTEVSELWFYNLSSGEIYAKLRRASQSRPNKGTSRPRGSK